MTYAKDKDNDSNERNFSGIQPEDFNNLDLNYGYSNRDQRWKGVVNGVWQSPYWGIGLSGSFRYATGSPYTATAGRDLNNDGISGTDRPTVNGVHFDRNSFRQPELLRASTAALEGLQGLGGQPPGVRRVLQLHERGEPLRQRRQPDLRRQPRPSGRSAHQPDAERQLRHRGRRGHPAHDPARPPVRLLNEARSGADQGGAKAPPFHWAAGLSSRDDRMDAEMRLENLRSERARYGFLFVILACGIFASHLRDGYLSDDFLYVAWARRSLATLLAHLTIASYPQVLRPLPAFAWLLSRLASGPLWLHLLALAVHGANSALLFAISRKWGAARSTAFILGFLFLVFPLSGEIVLWLSSGFDLWAAFFALLAVAALQKEQGIGLGLLFYALALLCKESASACRSCSSSFFRAFGGESFRFF